MAEIARLNIPLANYPSGSREFGPVAIPDRVNAIEFAVARCTSASPTIWPSASTTLGVTVDIEVGGEWREAFSFTASGGIASTLDPGGASREIAESGGLVSWPAEIDPTRIRARATVSGGPLRTSGRLVAVR